MILPYKHNYGGVRGDRECYSRKVWPWVWIKGYGSMKMDMAFHFYKSYKYSGPGWCW